MINVPENKWLAFDKDHTGLFIRTVVQYFFFFLTNLRRDLLDL